MRDTATASITVLFSDVTLLKKSSSKRACAGAMRNENTVTTRQLKPDSQSQL